MTGQRRFEYAASGVVRLDPSPADSVRLGKYEVHGTLGRGAMSTVYLGWDPVISRKVAIKAVPLSGMDDTRQQEELDRFRREAQAVERLRHPNIVGVLDCGETDDVAFIVMDFVDGRTLKSILDQGGPLPHGAVLEIMTGLLAGLQYSHERGVVHRDIKPANLIIAGHGEPTRDEVRITDFGIARIENSDMTQMGTVLGTPAYMSPEQHTGEAIDARTDLYSAGVVLFHLLTGQRPFDGSLVTITHQVLYTPPPRASEFAPAVPASLDAVVSQAMARRPENRFQSADAFAKALAAAFETASREPVSARAAEFGAAAQPVLSIPARPEPRPARAPAPPLLPQTPVTAGRAGRRAGRRVAVVAATVVAGAFGTWGLVSLQPSLFGGAGQEAVVTVVPRQAASETPRTVQGPAASPNPGLIETRADVGASGASLAMRGTPVPMPVQPTPDATIAPPPAGATPKAPLPAGNPNPLTQTGAASDDLKARFEQVANSRDPVQLLTFAKDNPSSPFGQQALALLETLLRGQSVDTAPAAARDAMPDAGETSPASTQEPLADKADRRRLLEGLIRLGHYTGSPDSEFGPDVRSAIGQYQAFEGHPGTGELSDSERAALALQAQDLAALLAVQDRSPRGQPAASIPGNEERRQQGWTFETGTGQRADPAEASYWYSLAAAQGNRAAMLALGNMKMRGKGLPKPDPSAARALWLAAAARGEPGANYNLGVATERGIGVEPNLDASLFWYRRAAALNSNDAILALKRLER